MTLWVTRRKQRDFTSLFNIINSRCNCPELLLKINIIVQVRSTRQMKTLYVSFYRLNQTCSNYIPRMLRLANLHNDLRLFNILFPSFKTQLLFTKL